jgi:membrane protein DedA with SNARE-associated domain
MTAPPPPAPTPTHPRWVLPAIGAGIICLIIANNTGNAVWASWVDDRPYGLIALNSSNKFILATSVNTTVWIAVVVSTLRLLAPDPLFYLLGYLYRERALHWARTAFPAAGNLLDQFEADRTGFRRVLDVLLVVAPNNVVCLLAGVNRFPIRRFVVLNVVGTVGRVLLMQWIGWIFRDQIEDLLDVVARYQRWLLWGSIALVVAYVTWQIVARRGLIGGVEELEEELGDH